MSGSKGQRSVQTEAFESIVGRVDAPIFLTCEHASEILPDPWQWSEADRRLIGTHWAYDLGAREVTIELAQALDASAVLSRFTRLLIDPNRDEANVDLFRTRADGGEIALNRQLSEEERLLRLESYYRPFHAAVDRELARVASPTLLSIHTFTPVYEGHIREVELGVLFNREAEAAHALGSALQERFSGVAYNEPWSGLDGLIFSAETHAERHGRCALELEVRQDRAEDPVYRAELVKVLAEYFKRSAG